jgi:hypothetical protein
MVSEEKRRLKHKQKQQTYIIALHYMPLQGEPAERTNINTTNHIPIIS